MNPVDRYIARATFGLPGKKRLDTAAELRVHLLQRVDQLQRQGFSREEAEHLAVERMGSPGPSWKRVTAGVFSRQVGWAAAGALSLALAVWLVLPILLRPAPSVQPTPTTFDDIEPFLAGVRSFDAVVPERAVALRIGVQVRAGDYFEATTVLPAASEGRIASPRTVRLVTGAAPASESTECTTGAEGLFVRSRVGAHDQTIAGCLPFGSDGVWEVVAPEGAPLHVDAWTPVVVFQPMQTISMSEAGVIDAGREDPAGGGAVSGDRASVESTRTETVTPVDGFVKRPNPDPDTWLVVSLYASSAEIGTFTAPPPPSGADVAFQAPTGPSL
ncbi:MAG: permease prefix domain 1-containing protein [Trueperaceae bacterium]